MNLADMVKSKADWIVRNPYVFSFYKLKGAGGTDVSSTISSSNSAVREFSRAVSRLSKNKGIAAILTTKLEPYSDTLSFACAVSEGSSYRFVNYVYSPSTSFLNESVSSYRIESRLNHVFDMFSEKLPSVSPRSWVLFNRDIESDKVEKLTKYSGFFSFFN